MKAVAYLSPGPVDRLDALVDVDLPVPVPGPGELLVAIHAASVNPCDVKMRATKDPQGKPRVLGYDAAGVVEAVGGGVTRFKSGDRVFYMGNIARPGCHSEYHCVDEALAGPMPASLDFIDAAALPLTALTAWETLVERMALPAHGRPRLLVIGGAGGVGSMAIQWARALSDAVVVATAGRPESQEWCLAMGAHHVIDHGQPLMEQAASLNLTAFDYILSTSETAAHWPEIATLLAPRGHVGVTDDAAVTNMMAIKPVCGSFHWAAAFTRPRLNLADRHIHGAVLGQLAELVDSGRMRSTRRANFGPINAANMIRAHAALESGRTIGKIVLSGF